MARPRTKEPVLWAVFHDNGEPMAGVLSWTRRDAIRAVTDDASGPCWGDLQARGVTVRKVRVVPI